MTLDTLSLVVGLGLFVLHALLTLVLLRVPGSLSPVLRHGGCALAVHVAGMLAAGWWLGPLPYWPACAVFAFGSVVWLFAYSGVYKSVCLRILGRLVVTPGEQLALEQLTEQYVLAEFKDRTQVLQLMGLVDQQGDGMFLLTAKGAQTARWIQQIQRWFGIQHSGLYGATAAATGQENGS
jgi:hypothetical protein